MPRFPRLEELHLPCVFTHYLQGRQHQDGRRYLPLLLFDIGAEAPIGVVDRHHVVDPQHAGLEGNARLVFLLSNVSLQPEGERRHGLIPEANLGGRASTAPEAYGRVVAVPTWEEQRGKLEFESLYLELLLDIGSGIVGVRTATTDANLSQRLGKERIEPSDWVHVGRSRIDILGFEPFGAAGRD